MTDKHGLHNHYADVWWDTYHKMYEQYRRQYSEVEARSLAYDVAETVVQDLKLRYIDDQNKKEDGKTDEHTS